MSQIPPLKPLSSQAEFAWFLGSAQSVSPAVRRELLATIQESVTVAFLAGCLTFSIALCAWHITGKSWALFWLIAEAVILTLRLPLLSRQHRHGNDIGLRSYLWLNRITSIWSLVLGLGALGCLLSDDLVLIVLASNLLFGLVGALALRLAAAPRFALLLKVLLLAPCFVALWLQPSTWLGGLLISAVFYSFVMQLLTLQNHRLLHDKIAAEHKNTALLKRDSLTGLSNRRDLRSTLRNLQERTEPVQLAVLCLDLDGFKAVNDQLGHPAGDQLLIEVGQRLRRVVRTEDLVCRVGGDEFIILLIGVASNEAIARAKQIITSVEQPFAIADRHASVGVSIGITTGRLDTSSGEALIQKADAALYEAKRSGKGRYVLSPEAEDTQ